MVSGPSLIIMGRMEDLKLWCTRPPGELDKNENIILNQLGNSDKTPKLENQYHRKITNLRGLLQGK